MKLRRNTPHYSHRSPAHERDPDEIAPSSVASPAVPALGAGGPEVAAMPNVRWQPFWLRQRSFGSFSVLFLFLTALFATMTFYSRQHNGLFQASDQQVYLWRFGPAAILTLISILWSRVELQSLRYMHWMVIREGGNLGRTGFKLDYSQMLLPMVLLRSLWLRHDFVFLIVIISIVLKAQIVLSAALFQLQITKIPHPIDVRIADFFITDEAYQGAIDMAAYDTALAVREFDMALPFGASQGFAYQTFAERGTATSPIEAVVDGLFMNTTCRKMSTWTSVSTDVIESTGYDDLSYDDVGAAEVPATQVHYTVDMEFQDCDNPVRTTLQISLVETSEGPEGDTAWWNFNNTLEPERPCSSLPQQHRQFLYLGAKFAPSEEDQSIPDIEFFHAVLCSPSMWLSKVSVVDNGARADTTVLQSQDVIEVHSNPWDILIKTIPFLGTTFSSTLLEMWTSGVSVNGPVYAMYQFRGEVLNLTDDALFQSNLMEQAVMDLTNDLGPLLGHYMIRQGGESQVEGTRSEELVKLHVNERVGISMMVLFILPGIVSVWATVRSRRRPWIWYRDPATVLGFIIFYSETQHREDLAQYLVSRRRSNKEQWAHGAYSPLILRSWVRLILTLFTMCLIAALSYTLRSSQTSDGLATISGPDSRFSLLWTSLPALLMLIVAQYVAMSDSAIRGLATLTILSARDCGAAELDMSLLDMLGLRALYHSLRLKVPAVTLTQVLSTVTAFLTALSAVLFTAEVIPKAASEIQLDQQSWFGSRWIPSDASALAREREKLSSLILSFRDPNLTYPSGTYKDLVFPNLQLDEVEWDNGVSITANIPAAKLIPDCTRLSEDDFEPYSFEYANYSSVTMTQNSRCPDGTGYFNDPSEKEVEDGTTYFTHSFPSPDNPVTFTSGCDVSSLSGEDYNDQRPFFELNPQWRLQTFVWGTFSTERLAFDYFSAWQCNYSWAEVVMETVLVQAENGSPMIDHTTPPRQLSEEYGPWTPPFAVPDFDGKVALEPTGTVFPNRSSTDSRLQSMDFIFKTITEPLGPIKLENFEDENYENQILEALHSIVGVAAAQLANVENRLDMDETSVAAPLQPDEPTRINATVANTQRYRLVQNQIVTFVIIGILALVVLVNVWALISTLLRRLLGKRGSWLLNLDLKGLAPDGYSSIEIMEALLHGSNVGLTLLPNSLFVHSAELYSQLGAKRFRMGWFQGEDYMEPVYTVGEVHDEALRFLEEKDAVEDEAYEPVCDSTLGEATSTSPPSRPSRRLNIE